jgi:hypothetical protein
METLLRNDYTINYGLPVSITTDISQTTIATYFEIEDDAARETKLHFIVGNGIANYRNNHGYKVTIVNYDKFVTGLPHFFQQGKKRCDLIVHTDNMQYFLLNELKDKRPHPNVAPKATAQLLDSLTHLMAVPTIETFANTHSIKQCCFFNKQSNSPITINATAAFNRASTISSSGLKMSNADIEAFGFELYEYSGNQVYTLS